MQLILRETLAKKGQFQQRKTEEAQMGSSTQQLQLPIHCHSSQQHTVANRSTE